VHQVFQGQALAINKRSGAVILSGGATATTDYFLVPHLENLGYEVTLFDYRAEPFESAFDVGGCRMVVISRYVSGCWFGVLERLHRQGARLVYFMDDDLFDIRALRGLPLRYQWKIVTQAWIFRSRLMRMCDEFWVSTDYLAEKYARLKPVQIDPLPSHKTIEGEAGIHVCYHGTASHRQEIEWLVPVIEAVQACGDNIHFELFGTHEASKQLGKLPRVSVLHPMTWPNYLAFTSAQQRDIALAPLLPGQFNAARGPTKFYDYTRMGAVGLFSNVNPYGEFVRNGVDGLLLDNDPAVWTETILMLAQNEPKRESMAEAARQRLSDLINTHQR
jgi:hypothetical protein